MVNLLITQSTRPDRISTPESQKDEKYHSEYGRFVVGACNNSQQSRYVDMFTKCMSFYMGNQWIDQEDIATFFIDDQGETNNRIRAIRNFVQPMVEQWRGNAMNMSFRFGCRNMSPGARSRYDDRLNRLLTLGFTASQVPMFKEWLAKVNPAVGETPEDTKKLFSTFYRDEFVREGNRLLNASYSYMELDSLKGDLAMDVATAGICILYPYIRGGRQLVRRVIPDRFGWDRRALDPRLRDSEYFMEYSSELLSDIFEEHYDIDPLLRRELENISSKAVGSNNGVGFDINGRAHVYTTTWRDISVVWCGYVMDEYGQVVFKRLDYPYGNDETKKYTEADLLPYTSLTPYQKKVVRNKGISKVMIPCDVWRFCKFIPAEYTSAGGKLKNLGDIVLSHGEVEYQEEDIFMPTSTVVPYKVGTWVYAGGDVISPVEAMINPQRLVNRFYSIMENQINNSGGAGPVIDQDQVGNADMMDLQRRVKQGAPIFLHAKGMGVQNAVGTYDTTIKNATMVLSSLAENYKRGMEEVSGVNQALKGGAGPDQLVGVMQLMMQKGSVIQEPFYGAIESAFKGVAQCILSVGRKLYTDNSEVLHDMSGMGAVEVFKLTKDIRYEQLLAEVVRFADPEQEKQLATQTATQFLQIGLLDKKRFARVVGVSTMAEVYEAVRETIEEGEILEKMQAKAAQANAEMKSQEQAQVAQSMREEQLRVEDREDINKQLDREAQLESKLIPKQ